MNFLDFVKNIVTRETSSLNISIFAILLILIPFSIKYTFLSDFSYVLENYSDFTSYSLYLSDLLLILLLLLSIFRKNQQKYWILLLGGLIMSTILALSADQPIFSIYIGARIVVAIIFGFLLTNSDIWLKYRNKIIFLLIGLGVIQSLIALLQFIGQSSLGLNLLGESPIIIFSFGVAKIVTHGTTYIRGYGTFPHPNILAGFLVIISLLNLYLLNKKQQSHVRLLLISSYFVIILGLGLSFSRAGLLAAGIATILFLVQQAFLAKSLFTKTWLTVFLGWGMVTILLAPMYTERMNISDQASQERSIYNQAGMKMALDKPIIGTGAGESVLHMQQYSDQMLEPWQLQPIHNYYLTWIVEWGVLGIGVLMFILFLFYKLFRKTLSVIDVDKEKLNWLITLTSIFASILILFYFDHYFYTIWPMQIFLWLILGLVYREIKKDPKVIEAV